MNEIRRVKQHEGEPHRRWFMDDYWDLYVWTEDDGSISAFQLCYGKPYGERALDWHKTRGYRHSKVSESTGGRLGPSMDAPLLVQDGVFDIAAVARRFSRDSEDIDPEIRNFIHGKILEFSL